MEQFSHRRPRDLHALRAHLYASFGWTYHGKSVPPAGLPMLAATQLIRSPSGAYRCNGHIRGEGYGGTIFDMHEVAARIDMLPDGTEPLSAVVPFDGLVISLTHHVSFLSRTIIRRDLGLLNPRQIEGMKRVALVDSTFERRFEVYSDDQVEGRALLTPDFMERLIAFDAHPWFADMRVGFLGNRMYAVLPAGIDLRFSNDAPAFGPDEASRRVIGEIRQVFDVLAALDALQACARAATLNEVALERQAFYEGKSATVEQAVAQAIADGALAGEAAPSWTQTEVYRNMNPAYRALLGPMF